MLSQETFKLSQQTFKLSQEIFYPEFLNFSIIVGEMRTVINYSPRALSAYRHTD